MRKVPVVIGTEDKKMFDCEIEVAKKLRYWKGSNENLILAVILARSGSKGIKNKNIKILNGKPLIAWSIATCLKSKE